ncbi:hypothetical protein [uncultured Vibrio sp.]|uniref:hypothetical protein n=1 Tax=uncultured Vibrio sp. TaxID=114054 RepID=UPI000919B7B2|nr:hypothetical protein [uncultured Vibrio sp.]OIQ26544.1 MAG: hypothetical protein BM561_01975 [Vibrio sp. MedPE-SWchi]
MDNHDSSQHSHTLGSEPLGNNSHKLGQPAPIKTSSALSVWLKTFIVMVLCFVGSFKLIDDYTHEKVNQSIVHGTVAYASVKTLSTGISAAKGVEFSVGLVTTRLGELLEPVNETLVYTSHIIMTALASLGLQKMLLVIFSSALGNSLLLLFATLYLLSFWVARLSAYERKARSLFVFTVFVRFSLAISLGANALIDQAFIDPQIDVSIQRSNELSGSIDSLDLDEVNSIEALEQHEDQGFWSKTKGAFDGLSQSLVDTQDQILNLPQLFNNYVMDFMNLIALFLLKSILLPILFLYMMKVAFHKVMNEFS